MIHVWMVGETVEIVVTNLISDETGVLKVEQLDVYTTMTDLKKEQPANPILSLDLSVLPEKFPFSISRNKAGG